MHKTQLFDYPNWINWPTNVFFWGLAHAREVVTVELHDTVLRVVDDDGEILKIVPRTTDREVIQHKAHGRDVRVGG